jgi:hypothetical protein
MGFLRALFGRQAADRSFVAWKVVPIRDDAVLEVVGEASYQGNLQSLGGRRGREARRTPSSSRRSFGSPRIATTGTRSLSGSRVASSAISRGRRRFDIGPSSSGRLREIT